MVKKKIKPEIKTENAEQLWQALFAITRAVEEQGFAVKVNQYRNQEMDIGAWEFARLALVGARKDTMVN